MKKVIIERPQMDGDILMSILPTLADGIYDFRDRSHYTTLVVVSGMGYNVSHGLDDTCTRRDDFSEMRIVDAPALVQEYAAFLREKEEGFRAANAGRVAGDGFRQ